MGQSRHEQYAHLGTTGTIRKRQMKITKVTAKAPMSYRLEALEHHHFKYADFRRPEDVHCQFFGTSTLSFVYGIQIEKGDLFEYRHRYQPK